MRSCAKTFYSHSGQPIRARAIKNLRPGGQNCPFLAIKLAAAERKPDSVIPKNLHSFICAGGLLRLCAPETGRDTPDALRTSSPASYIVLHRTGFSMPARIAPAAVVSYTPFSPLPLSRRFVFCCTFRAPPFSGGAPPFRTEFRSTVSGLSSRRTERMPAPRLSLKSRKTPAACKKNRTPKRRIFFNCAKYRPI